jgi:hypothetical protein
MMDECKQCEKRGRQAVWLSYGLGEMAALALQYGADDGDVQAIANKALRTAIATPATTEERDGVHDRR